MSTIEVRRCLLCGEAYATTSNRRKYCCDCIKVVQAVRNLDYYKKNREKSKEYQRKYKKKAQKVTYIHLPNMWHRKYSKTRCDKILS